MLRNLVLVIAIAVSAAEVPRSPEGPVFYVIVHRSNPVSSVRKEELSAIFMKRARAWKAGGEIVAVEPSSNALREVFSLEVHGKSLAFVTRYWHRLIFSGRSRPPVQLKSSKELIEFVAREPRAIAYIDHLPDDAAVKAIEVVP